MHALSDVLTTLGALRPLLASQQLSSSVPISPEQERLKREIEGVLKFGSAIHSAIQHGVQLALHVVISLGKLVFVVGLVFALLWVVLKEAGPLLAQRLHRRPLSALRIVPAAQGSYQPENWIRFYRALYIMATPAWKRLGFGQPWIALEFQSRGGRVVARCWYPKDLEGLLRVALNLALPGAELIPEVEAPVMPRTPAARARLRLWRDPLYPLGQPRADGLSAAISALAGGDGIVQLTLAPDVGWERRAAHRVAQLSGADPKDNLVFMLIREFFDFIFDLCFPSREPVRSAPLQSSRRPQLQPLPATDKAYVQCWKADVRLCCWASASGAAKHALRPVLAGYQTLDGANGLRSQRVWWRHFFDRALAARLGPGRGNVVLTAEEMAELFHLPLIGIPMDTAQVRLAPDRLVSESGSMLCRLEDGSGRAVRISQADRRHHLHALGPTGSGKSTLLLNLALQDIEAGIGVGVLDPKGDLIRDLLERIPERHADRLVLVDPSRRERPIGLNVLDCDDSSQRELVCDGVTTIFRKSYERFWDPRTDDILRATLLTLLREPKATLCEVPLLLLNQSVRARLTKNLDDPVGLKPFWEEYEALAEGHRLQMIGPVLNKLRTMLLRPTVRNVLGQSRSTVDLIDHGGILFVNLAKGALGEDTSRLLGSFVVARLWQAALGRAARPEAWRPDFNLYLDEFHNYLNLPQSLDDVLAEARAYRFNLSLANQHLGQLTKSTRQAVETNARTRVVFQCGQDDARYLAREFLPLSELDLQSLGRFQAAVRLCVNGHSEPPFTGVTESAPPSRGEAHAAQLAEVSLSRHGRPRVEVEAEIEARLVSFGLRGGFREIA